MDSLTIKTGSEAETMQLGNDIAMILSTGDLLCLEGDLGTGKSVLARGIIRQLAGDDNFEVPSPTYTLCQIYETIPPIAHFDLYRISGMDELDELGWQEALETGAVVIEWPEQCFEVIPADAIHIKFEQESPDSRIIKITCDAGSLASISRNLLIRRFLDLSLHQNISRTHLMGDASARSYELVDHDDKQLLLMNAPALPDGPPIKDGKPYSKIAHLAEDVSAFVAIDKCLREKGFRAPEIIATDLEKGLLLIEHLGNDLIIDKNRIPITERYMAAVEFLAKMHECKFENAIKFAPGQIYHIPSYDKQAIMIEVDLLLQWYVPSMTGKPMGKEDAITFEAIWHTHAEVLKTREQTLVLRDYHSPNILWRKFEEGTDRIGVIDFQDAVIGPAAYDVASLAQDARVDISVDLENLLVNHYIQSRQNTNPGFDADLFRADYATMAAQRATKILGIFIRLNKRDGKPAYLKHLPRIQEYLQRNLKHPVLSDYRDWFESVIKL